MGHLLLLHLESSTKVTKRTESNLREKSLYLEQRGAGAGQGGGLTLVQVENHLVVVQRVLGRPRFLQTDHNGTGVVRSQHPLTPAQQSVPDQLTGAGHSTRHLWITRVINPEVC